MNLRLSPDGTKIAYNAVGDLSNDIWVDELARGARIRLTKDPGILRQSDLVARRKPDSVRRGQGHLPDEFQRGGWQGVAAARGKPPRRGGPRAGLQMAGSSSSCAEPPSGPQDVWVLPLVGDRKPRLFVQNAFDGQFSPDGRWVSYTSPESGTPQVNVVPFDATKVLDTEPGAVTSLTGKYQISASSRRHRPVARGRQGNLLPRAGRR